MIKSSHWEKIYATRPTDRVGWYAPHLETSSRWIADFARSIDDPVIDVGGGASTLVDDLLDQGYRNLTVLDLAENALRVAQQRLGERAQAVAWLHGDVTEIALPRNHYLVWHDRAVFHFLVEPGEQRKYIDAMREALRPKGCFIVGAFAPEAPPRCSGLPVQRYTPERLCEKLGTAFELLRRHEEIHVTPSGVEQAYVYCLFRKTV